MCTLVIAYASLHHEEAVSVDAMSELALEVQQLRNDLHRSISETQQLRNDTRNHILDAQQLRRNHILDVRQLREDIRQTFDTFFTEIDELKGRVSFLECVTPLLLPPSPWRVPSRADVVNHPPPVATPPHQLVTLVHPPPALPWGNPAVLLAPPASGPVSR